MNKQPIEKKVSNNPNYLDVHSIFYTIQGEGPHSGKPAVFIRLAGCNLQCPGCDTEYTSRSNLSVNEIIETVYNLYTPPGKPLVVITGGEPFRQNITQLVNHLLVDDKLLGQEHAEALREDLMAEWWEPCNVQIETNGTLAPPNNLSPYCDIVCSPKAGKVNKQLIPKITAYKYVLNHKSICKMDGLPLKVLGHNNSGRVARPHNGFFGPVYVQPEDVQYEKEWDAQKEWEENKNNTEACVKSALAFGYTLQLQIHKTVGVE